MIEIDKMIKILEECKECEDGWECPFGMFGKNEKGAWGCFAQYPNGDPNEENQGCIGYQAGKMLKEMKETIKNFQEG